MNNEELINKLYNLVIKNTKGEEQILLLNTVSKLKLDLPKHEEISYNENMENNTFKLMFDDLNDEAKKELLSFYGVEGPEDLNLDVFPLTEIVKDEA